MERFQTRYSPLRTFWAARLVQVTRDGKTVEEWRGYNNPTIGELRSLRQKGAIVLELITERHGNWIDRTWVTAAGVPVVVSSHYLPMKEEKEQ